MKTQQPPIDPMLAEVLNLGNVSNEDLYGRLQEIRQALTGVMDPLLLATARVQIETQLKTRGMESAAAARLAGSVFEPIRRGGPAPDTARPTLSAADRDSTKITALAENALEAWNNHHLVLFRSAGQLVRLEREATGGVTLRPLTVDRLTRHLGEAVNWITPTKGGAESAWPPERVVRNILANPSPPFPPLDRIVAAPVFAPDGTLVDTPGYHRAARVFYEASGLTVPPIPRTPTADDVRRAVNTLAEPLADFPFDGDAERAHAFALCLLPFMRSLIDGPTPLHLVEKPAPGTGASMLVGALTIPALGRQVTVMTAARDDDEWRKRLTAAVLGGPAVISIDNLRDRLDSQHLSAMLTAWPFWKDRPMGLSEMREIGNSAVWVATANNPALSNEMAGRVVRIRLDARTDRLWERTYRIPNLLEWVSQHRGELVAAALTLIRAWLVQGRPPGRVPLPRFEAWSAALGGVLDIAKIPGFLENLPEVRKLSDAEGGENRQLFGLWWTRFGEAEIGVAEAFRLAEELELPLPGKGEHSQRTRLGDRLKRLRGRRYALELQDGTAVEVTLEVVGKQHSRTLWRLARTPWSVKGSPRSPGSPPETPKTTQDGRIAAQAGEPGEPGEPFHVSRRPGEPRPRPDAKDGIEGPDEVVI